MKIRDRVLFALPYGMSKPQPKPTDAETEEARKVLKMYHANPDYREYFQRCVTAQKERLDVSPRVIGSTEVPLTPGKIGCTLSLRSVVYLSTDWY